MPTRRRRFRARPKPQVKRPPANNEIRVPEVRLIGIDGAQFGVMSTADALGKAQETGSDLVIVAEKANPPVARVLELGKYMYEKRKADAKQRSSSKSGGVKGVRIGFQTDEHDWNMRLNQAAEFIKEGNKVKVEMRLRGRERQRVDQAASKIKQFIQDMPLPAQQEGNISRSFNNLSVILTKA
ncbi:MAG: translation initiation factor IF-3 [Patescibacteria group bacterium]